ISMLGLAVGVTTLLISLALMAGLQGQIKQRLIASSPQLLIEPAGSPTITNAEASVAAGKRLGVNVGPEGIGTARAATRQPLRRRGRADVDGAVGSGRSSRGESGAARETVSGRAGQDVESDQPSAVPGAAARKNRDVRDDFADHLRSRAESALLALHAHP